MTWTPVASTEKNWSYLDVPLPGLGTFDPVSPRWQETWACVCGARHTGKRRVIERIPSISHSRYHAPKE